LAPVSFLSLLLLKLKGSIKRETLDYTLNCKIRN